MQGRAPTAAEKRHMDAVQALGCIACRLDMGVWSPAEIHHTEGKSKPGTHLRVLPLCFPHHREGVSTPMYVSRHPYRAQFEARYGTELELLRQVDQMLMEVASMSGGQLWPE